MKTRLPHALALVGALLGLIFGFYSTLDYAAHLDRRLHDVHCSFIPGAAPTSEAEACRAAMYSAYSALFRDAYWGGIPISLFALGAFTFFVGFAVYLLVSGPRAPKRSRVFFALVGTTPLLVSIGMFVISLTQLGSVCKTCAGIYIGSLLLAAGAWWGALIRVDTHAAAQAGPAPGAVPADPLGQKSNVGPTLPMAELSAKPHPQPPTSTLARLLPLAWLAALALLTLLPSLVYASQVPDHRPYLNQCGMLKQPAAEKDKLTKLVTPKSVRQATLFEDPLCPTCQAFHQRLIQEGVFDKLNAELALFPLDTECNWMLDTPLHPGACALSRAVICGGDNAREVLDWAYDNQEKLAAAGKAGKEPLAAAVSARFGPALAQCMDGKQAKDTLNRHLHFASANAIPVSTPQIYLSGKRVCDEDTDIGLRYTFGQLAPELFK